MMRLLFLCLLLPAATVFSEESEGSGVEELDDEDLIRMKENSNQRSVLIESDKAKGVAAIPDPVLVETDKTKGVAETSDQLTLIVIIAAVSVVALSVAVIVAIVLVRRRMHSRQQGIYSVPTEQGQKGAV